MIKQFNLQYFQGIREMQSPDLPGITVFIGKNDTGKTGLLKLLYATVKSLEVYSRKQQGGTGEAFRKVLAEKLWGVFEPSRNGLGSLVTKKSRDKETSARERLVFDLQLHHDQLQYEQSLRFSFSESTNDTINECTEQVSLAPEQFRSLFIPPKEVLTGFRAIRAVRDTLFSTGFDDTYQDLIKALSLPVARERGKDSLQEVNDQLEKLLGGTLEQTPNYDDFIFKRGRAEFGMSQTAEGIKKIGLLTTLIRNRQINSHTVLFMDEPETTLHPFACRELVRLLVAMANTGVQIFLASHSYFILKQLHIEARLSQMPVQCCSLTREEASGTVNGEFSDLLDGLPENDIVRESLAMYQDDIKVEMNQL